MLGGFALAALLLNTPAAIVAFFVYKWVLPPLFFLGAALMGWFDKLHPWIDFQSAQGAIWDWSSDGRTGRSSWSPGSSGWSSHWRSGSGGYCGPRSSSRPLVSAA